MESKEPGDVLLHRSHRTFLTEVKLILTVCGPTKPFFGEESKETKWMLHCTERAWLSLTLGMRVVALPLF